MRKVLFAVILALGVLCLGAYFFYKHYLPSMIADVIVKSDSPTYVPSFLNENLAPYKEPINKGAADFVKELHQRQIPVSQIVAALDQTKEEDIQAAIDELKSSKVKTTDEAFNIIASHVKADFDIEQLREPFKSHVNVSTIQKILSDKDFEQYQGFLDPTTLKNVAKEILVQRKPSISTCMTDRVSITKN